MLPLLSFLQENACLKAMNTFGIEARARYFATIQQVEEFSLLLSQPNFKNMPKFILGEGSNILFTQNYAGLMIKNAIKGIELFSENERHVWLKVGAGENWHDLVLYCIAQGYAGIENLSLIPGTVGAAPIQNIGAYGVELSDCFFKLEAINLQDGTLRVFAKDECKFAYRDSIFKNTHKNQYAILSIILQLDKKPTFHVDYGNIQETLQNMQIKELTIKSISDAIIHIRRNKLPDPKQLGNAGSFFKNPLISRTHLLELQKHFPQAPFFKTDNPEVIKIPAAWLIEQCGWKGKRVGDVGVYEKQALILVNHGNGNGADIQALAEKIQYSVQDQFGITLLPEVNVI